VWCDINTASEMMCTTCRDIHIYIYIYIYIYMLHIVYIYMLHIVYAGMHQLMHAQERSSSLSEGGGERAAVDYMNAFCCRAPQ
jgi:hypothetical protein